MNLKYIQIKKIFTDLEELKLDGIWFSGIEGEGEYKKWHNNSQLWIHYFCKDGKIDGEYKNWHTNGKLSMHCFFRDGKLDGEHRQWLSSGKLYVHKLYKDDKMVKDYLK